MQAQNMNSTTSSRTSHETESTTAKMAPQNHLSEKDKQQDGSPADDKIEYPKGLVLATIFLGIYLAVFLVSLDRTIITTAIPRITDDFSSLGDVGWYGSAYLVTACSFQILFGRIYTFYSPKIVYLTATFVFGIGSAVCGAAPNSIAFIIGRAIAGLGSGGIFAGNVVLIVNSVPLIKRPTYLAGNAAIAGLCSVIAPLLGGAFTDHVSWRWCFYINLPICAVILFTVAFFLKVSVAPAKAGLTIKEKIWQLDPLGNICFIPAVVCLLLALQWGGSVYAWSNARIIVLFVVFGILTIVYIAIQARGGDNASIPPRITKSRSIAASMWVSICVMGSFSVALYYLPVWFQAIKNASATRSGVMSIPLILAFVVGAMISGGVTRRIGYYVPTLILCAIMLPVGCGLLLLFKPTTGSNEWIGYQVILGLGLGLGMQAPAMAAQTVLAKRDVPMGIACVFFAQNLGGAIFIAVAQNLFTQKLVKDLSKLASIHVEVIINTGATELRHVVGADQLPAVLSVYNGAILKAFELATALAACTIAGTALMEWRSMKEEEEKQVQSKA